MSELRLRVPTEAVTIRRLRLAAWRDRILLVLVWAAGAAWVGHGSDSSSCWGPLLLLGGTAVFIGVQHGAPVAGAQHRGARGVLILGPGGIEVAAGGRRVRFARGEIVAGWTESYRDREVVVLETRGRVTIRAAVASLAEARAVLRAAGVAPDQRAVAFRLGVGGTAGTRAMMVFVAMILTPLAAVVSGGAVISLVNAILQRDGASLPTAMLLTILTVIVGTAIYALLRPLVTTTLRIGTDGVAIERLFHRRFVPRAALTSAGVRADRLVLWRRSGVPITLRTSGRAEAAAVAQRIREALEGRGEAGGAALSRLDRQGRPVSEWLRDARALAPSAAGYREASLDTPALLDVVEDGSAPVERRIAAAAALGGAGDDLRARVKAAAETCADLRLRAAIEAASEGEIEEAQIEEAVRAARGS